VACRPLDRSSASALQDCYDAVGIPDVPGSSGIDVKPPNVLLASAESCTNSLLEAPTESGKRGTSLGSVVALAFDDDLVRQVDDEKATVVCGNSTGIAAGLAC
jgi:hypothetical protein